MDALYSRMIDQVRESEDAELCKRILAIILTVYRPITLDELPALVEIPSNLSDDYNALLEIIAICGSFLTLRKDVISFVYQSAKDFLLEEARVEIFLGDREAENFAIFTRCMQTIFKTLRRDIVNARLRESLTKTSAQ